jgi:hypothetical protein
MDVDPPTFYRGGPSLTPRPGDVRVDPATGLLQPTHGVSVFDRPDGLERFGGAHRLDAIPDNLRVIQRGRDQHHHEIVPAVPMTQAEYADSLAKIVLTPV